MSILQPGSALIVNALLLLLLAFHFRRKKVDPLAEILWWLMMSAAWWSFFYGLESSLNNERYIHLLLSLEYPAIFMLPVLWLIFAIRLTGFKLKKPFHLRWLFLIPAINWMLLISNPLHNMFYADAEIVTFGGFSHLEYKPGPVFLFSHLLYSNLMVAAGLILLVRMFLRTKGAQRTMATLLLAAATFPYILTFVWFLDIRAYGFLDLTPFGFMIMGVIMASGFNRLTELEIRPIVLDSLFESQPDAVVVTDEQTSRLYYANALGKQLLDSLKSRDLQSQGLVQLKQLEDGSLFSLQNRHYQVLLKNHDEPEAGRKLKQYIFQDVSTLKQHEANLSALTGIMTSFGSNTAENIDKLLALLGEVLKADACFYNKKIGTMLITDASWNAPDGYQPIDKAEGHICNDVITRNDSGPVVIHNLQQTQYVETDPYVRRFGLSTYLGVTMPKHSAAVATLCVVFTQNRSFSESDLQFLNLVSYVISNEEDRKRQSQKLLETQVNLRAILENSLDSVWSVDTDFRLSYLNEEFRKAYRQAFHVELREGMRLLDTLPRNLRPVWQSRYDKALKGEHFVFLDSIPLTPDSCLFVEVSVMPIIVDGEITGISFFGRNVTEKYLSEQRLAQSEQRLTELNAAKDRLFSIISHDLRSPFNNIIGLSEVIEEIAKESGQQTIKDYATSILRVSKNAFAILENLLHWSRTQSGNLHLYPLAVNLTELIENELMFQRERLEQKLIVINNQVDPDHKAQADALTVAVIVRNLLSNAIKFSYSEGEIVLKSEHQQEHILLHVQDFGCGISYADQMSLFHIDKHPSRRGTQNEPGTGLGLILCKELAEQNGGHLLVQSKPGSGSTFTLVLRAATNNS
ncbi:MAG TPA: histidine kinase N-terminal 7TM domain-containing protein [Bacteroidales bacterium]|nr:histidine kinase N-terminal 7TM domain-containing protein [Bacteroidales bacterium]